MLADLRKLKISLQEAGDKKCVRTFVGFCYFKELLWWGNSAGKNTQAVGDLRMTSDPLFKPFKDKPSTNPRYES